MGGKKEGAAGTGQRPEGEKKSVGYCPGRWFIGNQRREKWERGEGRKINGRKGCWTNQSWEQRCMQKTISQSNIIQIES